MAVLVTGAAGFIGMHIVRALSARGEFVRGIDCLLEESYDPDIKRSNFNFLCDLYGVEMINFDIRDPLPTRLWKDITAVINLAAMPGLMKSWSDFDLYQGCNVTGVHRLLESSMEVGIDHFIQVSTSSVYGRQASGGENQLPKPISPYGVTKLAGERLVSAYGASLGLPYSILRYFSVYGPGQRPDMAYHIFCERILEGSEIDVFGDGLQSRSNTHVADVVNGTLLTLEKGPLNATANLAGGEVVSVLESIEILEEVLGKKASVVHHDSRPGDQRETLGDYDLLRSRVGYAPVIGIQEGLASQAEWHLKGRGVV